MNKRPLAGRLGVLTAAALLAALAGCLMRTSAPAPVVTGLLTASPAEEPDGQDKPLVEAYGYGVRPASLLSNTGFAAADLPYLRHWREAVGVAAEDVEAFAVVCFEGDARVLLVRTKGDVPQGNVMMACRAGTPKKMACGTKVYVGESELAVHFPQRDVALVADSVETMGKCLTRVPDLMKRLDDAGRHDLTAWHNKPTKEFTIVPDQLSPPPLLAKMQRVRLWADVALTFDAGIDADYADEETAKASKSVLAGLAEAGDGGVMLGVGWVRMLEATASPPAEETGELLGLVPKDLLLRVAKGLRNARVQVNGKTTSLTFRTLLKLDDRPACTKFFAHPAVQRDDENVPLGFAFRWNPNRDRATAPRSLGETLDPSTIGLPACDDPSTLMTLTVANVRKEDLVVFHVDGKGELTLPHKVPAGDAIDLDVAKGQRLVAVFLSDPYRVAYTAGGNNATWLIRPAPKAVPPTVRSVQPPESDPAR
jgi:hypothetical protein